MPSGEYIKSKGKAYGDGITMWMEQPFPGQGGRHRDTFTYGKRTTLPEMQEYMNLSPRDALANDLWDARRIYMKDGLYTPEIRVQLKEVIKENKQAFPDLFNK